MTKTLNRMNINKQEDIKKSNYRKYINTNIKKYEWNYNSISMIQNRFWSLLFIQTRLKLLEHNANAHSSIILPLYSTAVSLYLLTSKHSYTLSITGWRQTNEEGDSPAELCELMSRVLLFVFWFRVPRVSGFRRGLAAHVTAAQRL